MTNKKERKWCKGLTTITQQQVDDLKPYNSFLSHMPYTSSNIDILMANNFKRFFVYRDPRDQIISMIFWIYRYPHKRPHHAHLSIEELTYELINEGAAIYHPHLAGPEIKSIHGIYDLYKLYLPWKNHPAIYVTSFEKLIGEHGGSSKEIQKQEIRNIAQHIGLSITDEHIEHVIANLIGDTRTFRKGKIGSWREHFTEGHKQAFKKVAGQLLIDLGYEQDFDW